MITSLAFAWVATAPAPPAPEFVPVTLAPGIEVSLPKGAKSSPADATPPQPGQRMWSYEADDAAFTVGSFDLGAEVFAEATTDQILAGAVSGSLSTVDKGKVARQRDVVVNGWPGLDTLIVQDKGVAIESRDLVMGHTLYVLAETYDASGTRPRGVDRFLNSLTLTPKPAAGPYVTAGPTFKAFAPDGAGCSIGLPGKVETKDVPGDSSGSATFHAYLSRYGNRVYGFGYADLPKDRPDDPQVRQEILDECLDHHTPDPSKETVVHRDGLTWNSASFARSAVLEGRLDETVVGDRVFILFMYYPNGHAGSPDIDAFFAGFHTNHAQP